MEIREITLSYPWYWFIAILYFKYIFYVHSFLFDLMLYVQSRIFQSCQDRPSRIESVLSNG